MSEGSQPSALSRLFSHGGIYTVARIASQAAVFLLVPLYTHALGSEGVGIIEVTNAARGVLTFVLLQGLHAAWLRLRYDYAEDERRTFESSVTWYLVLSMGVASGLAMAFGGGAWSWLIPEVPFQPYGPLTIVGGAGAALMMLLERKLQADQRPRAFAVVTLVRTIGTLLLIAAFVAVGRGASGKLEAEALAAIVGAVAFWFLVAPRPLRQASWPEAKKAIRYGWPLVPHSLAGLANDVVDRVMITAVHGLAAAGVYAIGYRIATISLVIMLAVNQALAPLFIETMRAADTAGDPEREKVLRHEVAKLGTAMLALGVLLVQAVTAAGPELIMLLGTPEFHRSWHVLALVGAGVLAWVCYAVLSQSLTYSKDTVKLLPSITIAAALVNIGANWLLLPHLEIVGAAIATLLSNGTLAVVAWFLARRYLPPYPRARWLAMIALSLAGLGLLTVIEQVLSSLLVRELAKIAWLALFTLAIVRISGIRREDFKPRRAALSSR